ncbi:MAG: heavy metal translocating P-type ATPase [Filifactoraceae bacterium]
MSKLKKTYRITGLGCGNCGNKIQDRIGAMPEVEYCNLDFVMSKLTVKIDTSKLDKGLNVESDKGNKIGAGNYKDNKLEAILDLGEMKSDNEHHHVVEPKEECGCGHDHEGHSHSHEGHNHNHEDVGEIVLDSYGKEFDYQIFFNKISTIADKIEPGTKFIEIEKGNVVAREDNSKKLRFRLAKIVVSLILFFSALFLDLNETLKFSLYAAAYLIVGADVIIRAFKNIINGELFDENFLMTIATFGAFAIKEYPEGVVVMLFYQIGEFFQETAVEESKKSIEALMNIKPEFANIKVDNDIKQVSPEEVSVGDIIVVKPGEKLPIDGEVVEGSTTLNMAAITGESVPLEVQKGETVLSGAINIDGVIEVRTTRLFEDSTVSKILELVENASSKKAKTEQFITRFAKFYTPIVVLIAAIIAVVPPIFIQGAVASEWIYRALVFLVVSCPCALVISIPLGFFGGIGGSSRQGVLVKGGNYLEAMNRVDTVIFDKTGTLTKGNFNVDKIIPFENSCSEMELLELAAYGEALSNHPIARSIVEKYGKNLDKNVIKDYKEIPGHGITAKVYGRKLAVGNHRLMDKLGIDYKKVDLVGSVIYVMADDKFMGRISVVDEIKKEAPSTIKTLKSMGIRTVMLTGDNTAIASKVSAVLGINKFYAELLPQDKVSKIEKLKSGMKNSKVMFVGDGINDAPALALADIGVAMGGLGADAAVDIADVVIMNDDISKVVSALRIAKKTNNIVWQNITIAFVVKLAVLILGTAGLATIWEAVFADVGVAIIAIFNSMRAMKN